MKDGRLVIDRILVHDVSQRYKKYRQETESTGPVKFYYTPGGKFFDIPARPTESGH